MASHLPKNHPLRSFYRFLAFVAGAYIVAFGVVGIAVSHAHGTFSRDDVHALGLRTNLAFSVLSVLVGIVVIGVVLLGRNMDRNVNIVLGPGFMLVGLLMLTVMRTSANILNFDMATCIVSFVIGMVLSTSALYGEVATAEHAAREEAFRHRAPDPTTGGS
jgi:uncharacterized protein DUF4383